MRREDVAAAGPSSLDDEQLDDEQLDDEQLDDEQLDDEQLDDDRATERTTRLVRRARARAACVTRIVLLPTESARESAVARASIRLAA